MSFFDYNLYVLKTKMDIFFIFLVSLAATFLSVMSGGGSSIISLPIFLSMGMSLPLAVAVHKVAGVFWCPVSAYTYLKDRKIDWRFLILFSAIGLIGSYFGVDFVINTDQLVLKRIIGVIILVFVVYTFLKKDLGLTEKKIKKKIWGYLSYPFALVMGFYEGIMGSGNGIAFAVLTLHTKGFDFINALGYYFAIASFWLVFISGLYIAHGYFDLPVMAAGVGGSVIGSYFGSKCAKGKGNKFIKAVFVVVGAVLGVKMVMGW